jgi:phosphoglycolate phosphatase-like HAD superfamily hydrolase
MINITDYKVLLWDFDGVIMDSMPIRRIGFEEVLKNYPKEQVKKLIVFHDYNGGLSRYVKFRYFFEKIRGENIDDQKVFELAEKFSEIMLKLLVNEILLIQDTVNFIKKNANKYEMHIVSGSDGKELIKICEDLNLSKYFKTINGSPVNKNELVKMLLVSNNYKNESVALIGDSINDYDAANLNDIDFFGYNNINLLSISANYIHNFT